MRKRIAGRFVREDGEIVGDPGTTVPSRRRALQPREWQQYTRRRVAEALPEIVGRFVEEAKKGSIPHTKMLTVLSGLEKHAATDFNNRKGASLAALLIKELKGQPPQDGGAA